MKYMIITFIFIVGFFFGSVINTVPSIEINDNQGTVIGVEKYNNHYKVRVKCECWHGGRKGSFVVYTSNNYKVGDVIKIF